MSASAHLPTPAEDTSANVLCPMCDYSLRGLTDPRCPECGFTFDWPDLLDLTRRKHKYLFEHHPDRNVWSFARTAVGGLVPWRFWRSLRPEQPSNLPRLALYWLISAMCIPIVYAGLFAMCCAVVAPHNRTMRAKMTVSLGTPAGQRMVANFGSAQTFLDHYAPVPPSRAFFTRVWAGLTEGADSPGRSALILTPLFFAWPWATALALMIFQSTMRRARVRTTHVLRCCLYSFDVGVWFALIAVICILAALVDAYLLAGNVRMLLVTGVAVVCSAVGLMLLALLRLILAYRLYMRVPQAVATVLLATILTALMFLCLLINLPATRTLFP